MIPDDFFHFNWEPFIQFGLAGLILGVFFLLLIIVMRQHAVTIKGVIDRMSTDHRESNEAWRQTFVAHSNRAEATQTETNRVLRDLTQVMTENNVCIAQLNRNSEYEHREAKTRTNQG